jgi:4-alpha-glucanotransferase
MSGNGGSSADAAPELMRLAWSSPAALAITPLQDLLNLGSEARMNVPGRANGNWRWRVREDMLSPDAFQWLLDLTKRSKRTVRPAASVMVPPAREGATVSADHGQADL